MTVVAIAALALLRALGLRRRAAVAGAAAVMAAYCLACEGGASVARAGVVGGLGLAAELRSAPRERWYLLLAGLALLLAHQPRAIGDPGLQLSFAAVVGLFAIAPPLARVVPRLGAGPGRRPRGDGRRGGPGDGARCWCGSSGACRWPGSR